MPGEAALDPQLHGAHSPPLRFLPPRLASDKTRVSNDSHRWLYSCRGSRLQDYRPHAGDNCPSLTVTAARCLLRNLDRIDDNAPDVLPPHVARALWDAVRRSDLAGIRITQLLACYDTPRADESLEDIHLLPFQTKSIDLSFTGEPRQGTCMALSPSDTPGRAKAIADCRQNFQSSIPLLDSPNLRWTTSLHLDRIPLDWNSISALGHLHNLKYLWFHMCDDNDVSDLLDARFIRTLARMSREQGSFRTLRGLIINVASKSGKNRNHQEILRFAQYLPALDIVALPNSYHGDLKIHCPPPWRLVEGNEFHGSHDAGCPTSLLYGLYRIEKSSTRPPTAPDIFMSIKASTLRVDNTAIPSQLLFFARDLRPAVGGLIPEDMGSGLNVPWMDTSVKKASKTIRASKRRRLDDVLGV